jgi:hypothetical protein
MFDGQSRYRNQPTRELVRPDGSVLRYVLPRWIPEPSASTPGGVHRATDSDRIDNLARRYLGAPGAWWLIADASSAMHPDTIGDTPGEVIVVPLPTTGPVKG